ncbi:MAG: nucleoside-diphosphate kinase, partial [Stellaceae bacterium]
MAIERTLTIVKPDGVAANLAGAILGQLEQAHFKLLGLRRLH